MAAALGIIGFGVNAVSTVAGLGSASSSARAQKQAIADQELLSQDRLDLLKENFKFSQQWAQQNANSELATLRAQRVQSMQAITEQVLNNRAAVVQARMQAATIRTDTSQAVSRLLAGASAAQAETSINAANTLEAGVGSIEEAKQELSNSAAAQTANETVASQSLSGQNENERYAQAVIDQLTRLQENVLSADAAANRNTTNTKQAASIQQNIGNIQGNYATGTTNLQEQSNALYEPFARKQAKLSLGRNRLGIVSKNASAAASASASYAAQVAGEGSTQSQLALQRSQVKSPGFLSYLSAGAGIASGAYQAGLFSLGGANRQQPNAAVLGAGMAVPQSQNAAIMGAGMSAMYVPPRITPKNFSGLVRPRPYNQYTDVTGNTYG